jgi:hypothetical protein
LHAPIGRKGLEHPIIKSYGQLKTSNLVFLHL